MSSNFELIVLSAVAKIMPNPSYPSPNYFARNN